MARAITTPKPELIELPGYYFNSKLTKLARLHEGDKLPADGAWERIADLHEMSSSQVVRKLLDMHPAIDPQHLSYTVHGTVDRRVPTSDARPSRWGRTVLVAVGFIGLAVWVARKGAINALA